MKAIRTLLSVLSFFVLFVPSAWPVTLRYPVDSGAYIPGSYASRYFFAGYDHLGEDISLAEGTPVRAIGTGQIVWYYPSSNPNAGYGELAAVIEHDLGKDYAFINAYGKIVVTRKILSIYGHLRTKKNRGDSQGLSWQVGQSVNIGDVIGYVNDDAHNGDGAEHLHLGIRLSDKDSAVQADPGYWFRGYELSTDFGRHFASADAVIETVQNGGIQSLCSGLSSSGNGICWVPSTSSNVSCQSAKSWVLYQSYSSVMAVSSNQYCPSGEVAFSPYGSSGPTNVLGGGGTGGASDQFNLKQDFDILDPATGSEWRAGTHILRPGQTVKLQVEAEAKDGDVRTHMRPGKDSIKIDYYYRLDDQDWVKYRTDTVQASNLGTGKKVESETFVVPPGIREISFKVKVDANDDTYESNEGDNWSRIETFQVEMDVSYWILLLDTLDQ